MPLNKQAKTPAITRRSQPFVAEEFSESFNTTLVD
jgi:hypothetical protein